MKKDSTGSWIICAGAFVAMFLETGTIKCFGVLLPELREHFTQSTWVIGLSISLIPGFGALTCIAATGLKLMSSRCLIMLFSGFASFGLLLCSLARGLPELIIGLTCTGFLFSAEATMFSILSLYFDKYFDISNSIAHTGLSLGVMILPILTQFLLDLYGWRGSVLILAALNSNVVVCGLLLRPMRSKSKETEGLINKKQVETDSFKNYIIQTFDLDLFRNPDCVALLAGGVGYGCYYTGWLVYLVPHAIDLGFTPYASVVLATAGGFGNFVGSCVFPLMSKLMACKTMIIVFHLIAFLMLALDPLLSIGPIYVGLMLDVFVLNFAYAIWGCAYNKLGAEVLDERRLRSFMNWSYVTYGIGSIFSGFIAGWLYDKLGSFSISFLVPSMAPLLTVIPAVVTYKWRSPKPI